MAHDKFDYIIAGGGMAGLSLAFYLNKSSILRGKKILVIDRDAKKNNDHTWCFWEKGESAFEEIVFRRWQNLCFHGADDFSTRLDFGAYEYKMIRAADFYAFVFEKISRNPNIEFRRTEIKTIENSRIAATDGDFYATEFVFDSFTRQKYDDPKNQNLWQHFLGWMIETESAHFNRNEATLFDFRVEQKNECRFVYILPISERKALIEFTVFSENLLEKSEYETNLRKYIAEILRIENYKIVEKETGVIPMSDAAHEEFPAQNIVRIGTSGGYVKPSTGYSFERTQRKLRNLAECLEINRMPPTFRRKHFRAVWKQYLDSVLLNVLRTKKTPASEVFTRLFRDNPTERVLKFLDEETTFAEDLRVMQTVPLATFSKAALETILKIK